MGIKVSRSFGDLEQIEVITVEDMREVGLVLRERIIRRTLAGRDADGAPFAPYSEGYAKQKAQLGGAAHVNLQVSGAMMNAIQIINVQGWPKPLLEMGFSQ